MKASFVAGFGPIVRDMDASRAFWGSGLGIELRGPAVAELEAAGHRILRDAHEEPWGQTTSRLLSPEGVLVGVTYTPWMHEADS